MHGMHANLPSLTPSWVCWGYLLHIMAWVFTIQYNRTSLLSSETIQMSVENKVVSVHVVGLYCLWKVKEFTNFTYMHIG